MTKIRKCEICGIEGKETVQYNNNFKIYICKKCEINLNFKKDKK